MRRWLFACGMVGAAGFVGGCDILLGYREVVYTEPDAGTGTTTGATTTTTDSEGGGGSGGEGGSGTIICVPGTKKACAYSGPPGTENVGACRAAEQTCDADGTSWEPCEGEVLPAVELCHNQVDEDCDGAACAAPLWSKLWGDAGTQRVVDIAANAGGTLALVGDFEGSLDISTPALISSDATSFLAQIDSSGTGLWQAPLSFPVKTVDLRATGETLIAGSVGGTATVRTCLGDGTELWEKSFSGLAVAATGARYGVGDDVILIGDFISSVNFGLKTLSSGGSFDIFASSLSAVDGSVLSAERFGDNDSQRAGRMGILATGARVLSGVDVSMAGAKVELVVRQLDPANMFEWEKRYNGPVLASDLHVGLGTSIVVGSVTPSWVMISKLSAAGDQSWIHHYTSPGFFPSAEGLEPGISVALNSGGHVIFVVRASGTMDFGGGELGAAGEVSEFLVRLDASGNHLSSTRIGPVGLPGGCRIAVATNDAWFLGCSEAGRVFDFGSGVLQGKGGLDVIVAAFAP